jgi:cobalt-zinc-cadmium efflux system protein
VRWCRGATLVSRRMGSDHPPSRSARSKQRLVVVLGLSATYLVAEVVGALWTGSLALFADAGHMLTDVAGLALALFAIRLAERAANPAKTYGYHRAEILAAVANAVVLLGISFYVLFEAYERFRSPLEVHSGAMLAVAAVGLAVNAAGLYILRGSSGESLNMKGAYFEVLSDFLTSIGVIVAAVIMLTTQWYYADPAISAAIGLFILPRTWRLLREAVDVLLEGTPRDLDLAAVRKMLESLDGVQEVHDLHAWSLTTGVNAVSVHLVANPSASHEAVLRAAHDRIRSGFAIAHATLQVEPANWDCKGPHV